MVTMDASVPHVAGASSPSSLFASLGRPGVLAVRPSAALLLCDDEEEASSSLSRSLRTVTAAATAAATTACHIHGNASAGPPMCLSKRAKQPGWRARHARNASPPNTTTFFRADQPAPLPLFPPPRPYAARFCLLMLAARLVSSEPMPLFSAP